jgi:hypothetical protein
VLRAVKAPAADVAEAKRLYDEQRQEGLSAPIPLPASASPQPGPRQTIDDRLLNYVRAHPDLDDDELSRNLGIRPRQSINQAARRLAARGLLRRYVGPRGKIINRTEDAR